MRIFVFGVIVSILAGIGCISVNKSNCQKCPCTYCTCDLGDECFCTKDKCDLAGCKCGKYKKGIE